MKNVMKLVLGMAVSLPVALVAANETSTGIGPSTGDREFSISGTGSNDASFDAGTFGIVAEHGWYLQPNMLWGIRQSVNYASIEGESLSDDYWNGATSAYLDYQFGAERVRPFVGGNLGLNYGDGNDNSLFSGLEGGLKYYALPSTFVQTRAEYQWFFNSADDIGSSFSDGSFEYTLGVGFNY